LSKTQYTDEKVSFKVTDDFTIVESKYFKRSQSTYIRINYKGSVSDEYISITLRHDSLDLDNGLRVYGESRADLYKDDPEGRPIFGEYESTTFAAQPARQMKYSVAHEGPKSGLYTAFHCNGLSVMIGRHFTAASEVKINDCVKLIESGFTCK